MNRMIGLALGALIGLAMPVCAKEHTTIVAPVELIIVAVDHEGRHLWTRTRIFETYRAYQRARASLMVQYWRAVDNPVEPFRQGLKSKCLQRA